MNHQRSYSDCSAQIKEPTRNRSNSFKLFTKMNQPKKQPLNDALISSDSFDSFGTPSCNNECLHPQLPPPSWFQFLKDNQNAEENLDCFIGLDTYLPTAQRGTEHTEGLAESAQFGSISCDEVCQQSTDATTVGYSYEDTKTAHQSSDSSTQTTYPDSYFPSHYCCHCNAFQQEQLYALNEQYLSIQQKLINFEAYHEETQFRDNQEKKYLIELTVSMGRSIQALTQLLQQRNSQKSSSFIQEAYHSSNSSLSNDSIMSPPDNHDTDFNRQERNWRRQWAGI